jgi:spore coat polysaccharide biosynthesis predicted glycosyltransferase SpsG
MGWNVLFAVAAGASTGFGHLVRCGHLAKALGVRQSLVLRGSESALWTAIRLGWTVHRGPAAQLLTGMDLVVVDDPRPQQIARWVRAARRTGIPVAAIRDGVGAPVAADLVIDGSFPAELNRNRLGHGLRWALIDPQIGRGEHRGEPRHTKRVVIALGGGKHPRTIGTRIARDLHRLNRTLSIDIAAGFVESRPRGQAPAGCRWLVAPDGLAVALARASVAIVAGGVTLQEACALGTPAVAVAVVDGQRPAVAAAAQLGLASAATESTAAAEAVRLLSQPAVTRRLSRRATRCVDGGGVSRAAEALRSLMEQSLIAGVRDAA